MTRLWKSARLSAPTWHAGLLLAAVGAAVLMSGCSTPLDWRHAFLILSVFGGAVIIAMHVLIVVTIARQKRALAKCERPEPTEALR